MHKKALVVMALLSLCLSLSAQRNERLVADSSRWDFHLSTGVSVASGWGKSDALLWTAPRVEYRASDRLTLSGGFGVVASLMPGYELRMPVTSCAPRRHGTRLLGGFVSARYQASDRLNLWASVQRVTGWREPLWTPQGEALDISLTSVSGGFVYALGDYSFLEMHFNFVHDHYGNSALGLFGHPYYGLGTHPWDPYGSPWMY